MFVGIKCDRQFFPMYQIFTYGMSPMHIAPIAFVRIMLIEQVIFSVIKYQAVRVVIPSPALSIMDLRTVDFGIHTILSCNFISLIYLVYSGFIPVIGYFYLFILQGGHIAEYPIIRIFGSQTNIERPLLLTSDVKSHHRPVGLMRNRKVEILLRDFHCQVLCFYRRYTGHQSTCKN